MRYFYGKAILDHATVSIAGVSVSVDMLLESASRQKKGSKNTWHRNVYLATMMAAALHSLLARTRPVEPLPLRRSLVNCAMWVWLGTTSLEAIAIESMAVSHNTENEYSGEPEWQDNVSYILG